jgi:hypothetical protein
VIADQGRSAHFVYKYETWWNGAQQRAAALQATCESDLARLEPLFDAAGAFDGGNTVTVVVDSQQDALGTNNGYHTDAGGWIKVDPWSYVPAAATADDGAREVFVAELAEVLMSFRNRRAGSTSWDPFGSNGEGLSIARAAELYPAAFYAPELKQGPDRITKWLNDPSRPDWVTSTKGIDTDFTSFGCAMLFIYFLHSQKGFSLHDIITHGGSDLEATYRNLTGSGGGWNEFKALLDRFFPAGNTYSPKSCNLFPLYDDNRRSVAFSLQARAWDPPQVFSGGQKVKVSPCLLYPAREYSYEWVELNLALDCRAQLRGFGNPVVKWLVNGVPTPTSPEVLRELTVTGDVYVDRPDQPDQPARTSQTFHLMAIAPSDDSTYVGLANALRLVSQEHPGHEWLTIEVEVSEQYANVPAYRAYGFEILDTRFVVYEPKFDEDREKCNAALHDFMRRHVHYRHINILLTLPDPPGVVSVAAVLEAARAELSELAREEPDVAREAAFAIARSLRLPTTAFLEDLPGPEPAVDEAGPQRRPRP